MAIGDYLSESHNGQITKVQRKRMLILLQELHSKKKYRQETMYLAVSLADRFLINLSVCGLDAPCLVDLALTCLLVAAKMNQPLRPKFNLMNDLLKSTFDISVDK